MKKLKIVVYILSLCSIALIHLNVLAQTSKQFKDLKKVNATIILPTLSTSYRLINFKAKIGGKNLYGGNEWDYIALYRGGNNVCFNISATNRAMGQVNPPGMVVNEPIVLAERMVNNSVFGQILLKKYIDPTRRLKPWLKAEFYVNRANYFFNSRTTKSISECNLTPLKDAFNIIKSLKIY